jgi:RHS repeat-associated protein
VDDVGFATYTNDSATGLQYADQRYYASNFGRFMSPDPGEPVGAKTRQKHSKVSKGASGFSAKLGRPLDWNGYAYAIDDPVNHNDPQGRFYCLVDAGDDDDDDDWCFGPDGGDGGDDGDDDDDDFYCAFAGGTLLQPGWMNVNGADGYYLPVTFTFNAVTGNGGGTYIWYQSQSVQVQGAGVLASGNPVNFNQSKSEELVATNSATKPTAVIAAPNTSQLILYDAPGLAYYYPLYNSHLLSAQVYWLFELNVWVYDIATGQTANCPPVEWNAYELWTPGILGKTGAVPLPAVVGDVNVITQPTP